MPRKIKKYHYIYKTTNILNNKFYIGMHSTDDLNDGYLGSGKRLRYSVKKYGMKNHLCEILEFCSDRKTLATREKEIVNEELLQVHQCINLVVGGECSFEYYNIHEDERIKKNRKARRITNERHKDKLSAWSKLGNTARNKKYPNLSSEVANQGHKEGWFSFKDKKHSQETKNKMSAAKKNKFCGGNNSNAKAVIDDNGNKFTSLKECATFNNIHADTVRRRIHNGVYKALDK